MGTHIDKNGQFQSDKYPTCPAGKVPLSVKDATAQDLLWEYAQRRRTVDCEFSADLEACLKAAGHVPPSPLTEANANLILWCVHVLGADDVYAEPSHSAAVAAAEKLNRHSVRALVRYENDLLCFAYAAPWPHSAEAHAQDMKDRAAEEAERKAAIAAKS